MWKVGWTLSRPRLARIAQAHIWLSRCQSVNAAPETAISPALLDRAKSLEAEHALLSKQLVTDYDASIAKKAGSLSAIAESYKAWEAAKNV